MYQLTRPEVTAHLAERRDFKAFCSQAFPGSSSKILHLFSMRGNLAGSRADTKRIALVAHDNKKADLIEWARFNRDTLAAHHLCATGTTGSIIENELKLEIVKLQSGPLAGDQQIGAMISRGELDLLIFFCDALETQPHDPDVKALLRRTVVWNIPVACNRNTADFMIASPLMSQRYERLVPDLSIYRGTCGCLTVGIMVRSSARGGMGFGRREGAPTTSVVCRDRLARAPVDLPGDRWAQRAVATAPR